MLLLQLSVLAWLGRCWKYQEGALAASLQVQCADCSFGPALFDDIAVGKLVPREYICFLLPGTTTAHSTWFRIKRASVITMKRTRMIASARLRYIQGLPRLPRWNITSLLAEHNYSQVKHAVGREMCYSRRNEDLFSFSGNTMQDFVLCWNFLVQRTTTMSREVRVIIANLLRFNAFSILAIKSYKERMRAVL